MADALKSIDLMPVLFVGHGSPMNAIEDNEFVQGWRDTVKEIPKPTAILCVSAHWETNGTAVTAMAKPPNINDFGGFPRALYEVQYPAPGSPELAKQVKTIMTKTNVRLDDSWGLDHGCWSVLRVMYPKADIPIVQVSLDYSDDASRHYDLARELASLREKGVLIVGSGNMVHNLRMVDWDNLEKPGYGHEWATEANEMMKKLILADDHKSLTDYKSLGKAFDLAIPTPEHFLPLLYVLALKKEDDRVSFFNDKLVGGSLSMTSVKIGKA